MLTGSPASTWLLHNSEFIDYCRVHGEQYRPQFSGMQLARLKNLAGEPAADHYMPVMVLEREMIQNLCEKAYSRLPERSKFLVENF